MLVIMAFLIVLLISGTAKGADEKVLSAFPNQTMNCNERTVLQCNIISSMPLNIIEIQWGNKAKDIHCDSTSSNNTPGFECNYTREALTLTILHPRPENIGTYFCCIQALSTHDCKKFNVSLGECSGEYSPQMTGPTQQECSFNGVNADGMINWFHYDKNVTSNSTITSLKNSDGTFNISSNITIQDNGEIYTCSLWFLENGQYVKYVGDGVSQSSLSWTVLLLALMFSLRTCLSL